MYCIWKRIMDVVFSAIAILVLFVPMLMIAAAVKMTSKGPVLFWQKRVGKDRKTFMMPKFRSMYIDAPANVPTHLLDEPDQWITPVGRFIRRTSLDELPQLWCILKSDMSVIGPRPALWNQEDLIAEREVSGANGIRPGLTGWAQINGRDKLSVSEKVRLDDAYTAVLNGGGWRAFAMDCRCFFQTICKVLKYEGVAEGGAGEMNTEKDTAGQ